MPAAAVDPSVLESLRDLGGEDEPEFLKDLLTKFVEHADRAVVELRAAAACGDRERVRAVAHGLKGSAGNVGAKPLADLAAELEATAKSPGAAVTSADVETLAREVVRVRARLAAELR